MGKKFLVAIISIFILLSIVACGDSTENKRSSDQSSYRLETLKLEGNTDWGVPSPYLHDPRGPGTAKMKMVFDSLLDADENGNIPWLAKEWSRDGNVYTFTIHSDALFHDGQPVTTEDIAFTIDYYEKYPPVTNQLNVGGKSIIQSYQIVDQHTIKLTVDELWATTLLRLGSFVILPKHIWETVDDPYTYNEPDALIGCGGYKITSYEPATGSYEFMAFEDYYGRKPVAERVLFVPVSDPLLAFENNEIDITNVPADTMARYESNPNIGMIGKDNDMGYKLLINMEKMPAFQELDMRKAVYHALDRQAIVDKVFRGNGSVASAGYVPQTSIFYNEDVIKYPFDRESAQKVFRDKNLSVQLLISSSDVDVKMAELIKNDLENAGMKVNVVAVDGKLRDQRIFNGEYEFSLVGNGGWGRTPDYLRTLYSTEAKFTGSNPHFMGAIGHHSDIITKLAEDQLKELDFDKRMNMLKELQYEISKEIPIIVVATQTSYVMFKNDYYGDWVKTYDYQQLEQNRLSYFEN